MLRPCWAGAWAGAANSRATHGEPRPEARGPAVRAQHAEPEPAWCLNGEAHFGLNCTEMDYRDMFEACSEVVESQCYGVVTRDAGCTEGGWLWCEWGL